MRRESLQMQNSKQIRLKNELPFTGIISSLNSLPPLRVGAVVFVLFIAVSILVSVFHEPWLDEAQSWLIARDASYYDMIFKLPHIEGHIPFWWLLLSIPAKLGVPYEIGLKSVNLLISYFVCAFFLFRSPFPNSIKIFFPFTFFFLYQYTIVARPYMLLVGALFLVAGSFKTRNDKPVRFFASLLLLCLTDTFGIAIAGGIAAGWVIDIIRQNKGSFTGIWSHYRKSIICLMILLISAAILMLAIVPDENALGLERLSEKNYFISFLSEIFIIPSELCFTSFAGYGYLSLLSLPVTEIIIVSVLSTVIWAFFIRLFIRKDILTDTICPILTFMALGAFHINSHHYGIFLMIGIYCAWISLDTKKDPGKSSKYAPYIGWCGGLLCFVSLGIGIMWSTFSIMTDIQYPYWISRDLYQWIDENSLESYKWLAVWEVNASEDGSAIADQNTAFIEISIPVNPYFDGPLPLNYNNEGTSYALFRDNTDQQDQTNIKDWKEYGEPDFILCCDTLTAALIINEMGYTSNYDIVYIKEARHAWKGGFNKCGAIVLLRRDSHIDLTADLNDYDDLVGRG